MGFDHRLTDVPYAPLIDDEKLFPGILAWKADLEPGPGGRIL